MDNEVVSRLIEVLVLAGNPLVGTTLLYACHLQVEIADGDVLISPL